MEDLDFRILGSMEVRCGAERVALGGAKQRALLAILLLNANRVVTTDLLIEALWPENPPGKPLTAIQGYVSALRKVISPERGFELIVTAPAGYRLAAAPAAVDLSRFEALAEEGRSAIAGHEPLEASRALTDALALFRGAPLADFTYENWARPQVDRIEELRLACLEDRIDADLALGRHGELVGELDALTVEHPLRERLRGQLMLALYRAGRQAEALDVYQATRSALVDELGLEPRPETQMLHTRILTQDPALAAPERRSRPARIVQLPRPPSSFIGRAREVAEVGALIARDDVRLVTLTGPGGTGKTRLALEAAAATADEFEDGAVWVGLAALRDPALVTETISQALGTSNDPAAHIAESEVLLVLDNLEQVIESAPDLSSLLHRCPRLTLLVTSRELLRVQGEVEYSVPPLTEADAVSLFCARSQLGPSDEIAKLSTRLDNLPLAVELAAARTKALSVAQITERLSERLDFLTGGRDADPRQQTLTAAIDWSYDLLTDAEQSLFRRLSVFSGGCTLEAAGQVADATPDSLQSLVEKSLVRFRNDRYLMLETIREYGSKQLELRGELQVLAERHADFFIDFAETNEPPPMGGCGREWVERMSRDTDNLRRTLHLVGRDPDPTRELRVVGALFRFWPSVGLVTEGQEVAERALVRARNFDAPHLLARVLYAAALSAAYQSTFAALEAFEEERLEIVRMLGDDEAAAVALNDLAVVAMEQRAFERAERLLAESIELARRSGSDLVVHSAMSSQGTLDLYRGDYAAARVKFEELLRREDQLDDEWSRIHTLEDLGAAHLGLRSFERAAVYYRDALVLAGTTNAYISLECYVALAEIAFETGDQSRAAVLFGIGETFRRGGMSGDEIGAERAEWTRRATRAAIGEAAFAAQGQLGLTLSNDEAIRYVNELVDELTTNGSTPR